MPGHLFVSNRRVWWGAVAFVGAAGVTSAIWGITGDQRPAASAVTTPVTVASAADSTGTAQSIGAVDTTSPAASGTTPSAPSPASTVPTLPNTPATTAGASGAASNAAASSGGSPSVAPPTIATSEPCSLANRAATSETVPINQVCSSDGAPHFDTPQDAMAYLAGAWNAGDVQQIDYVTDPNGRQQLDSMADVLVNLRFERCTANPGGDYTCFFMHDVVPSTSPTTYPNPMNYPPGEAVFTVAPAAAPGWYLTNVIHCG